MTNNSDDPYNICITHILKLILRTTENILYIYKRLATIKKIYNFLHTYIKMIHKFYQ